MRSVLHLANGDITARFASHYLAHGRHYLRLRTLPILKIAVFVTPLIPCLIPPTDDRENSEGTPTQLPVTKKCYFLRLRPNKVDSVPEKVDSIPKSVALYSSPLHPTQKNHTKMRFYLLNSKKSTTFAP